MEAYTLDRAREGLKRAEKALDVEIKKKPAEDSESRSNKPLVALSSKEDETKMRCRVCRKVATAPCWFCIECEGAILFRRFTC